MFYYIFIPGLGENKSIEWQKKTLKKWNSSKRQAILIDAQWHNRKESYNQKYHRILDEIQDYMKNKDGMICIIGASAGGSMAVSIFEALQLEGAVTIAGKLQGSNTIGVSYQKSAPALYESVVASENVITKLSQIRKNSILTFSPLYDEVIAKKDMVIAGANSTKLLTPGHIVSIGYMLLFGTKKIFKWFEKST